MSKIDCLNHVKCRAELSRFAYERSLLYAKGRENPLHLNGLALTHLIAAECRDHAQSLGYLRDTLRHAMAGTVPAEYDEWGHGENDEAVPYDPYRELANDLKGESSVSPLVLSPRLLSFVEAMPEMERQSAGAFGEMGISLLKRVDPTDENSEWRPYTEQETARSIDAAMLEGVEAGLFTLTYAEDMARFAALVVARGPFQELLSLLD